jgi:coenzyme F420-reducing hydrogenase beta subunit
MSIDYSAITKYVGDYEQAYAMYAKDENVRKDAASGGIVSRLLLHLIEERYVDGVFVSRQKVEEGKIVVESFITNKKAEILDCRTSIYTFFPLEKSINTILQYEGKVAIVLLPCHLKMLEVFNKKYPQLKDKIKYKLCLFCGGVADDTLMYNILEKNKIDIEKVDRIYSRKGHWRGKTYIQMKDGQEKTISYNKNWSTYKNAYFYSTRKCFNCQDHFGYEADFSFGDIWLQEMKQEEIKHTAVIAKNENAKIITEEMIQQEKVIARVVPIDFVIKGNKRALIYKYHTAEARARIGIKYGYSYSKEILFKSKWNHYVVARLILLNMKISKSEKLMKIVFKIPNKIMYLYMCIIRFLISF